MQLTGSAGWWMLMLNSHGIKISIAGCVWEVVRGPNPLPFCFFLFSFFYHTLNFVSS